MLDLGWAGGGGCGCWDEDEGDWHESEEDEGWEGSFLGHYLSGNRRIEYKVLESEYIGSGMLGHYKTEIVDWAGGGGRGEHESVTEMMLQLYLCRDAPECGNAGGWRCGI